MTVIGSGVTVRRCSFIVLLFLIVLQLKYTNEYFLNHCLAQSHIKSVSKWDRKLESVFQKYSKVLKSGRERIEI